MWYYAKRNMWLKNKKIFLSPVAVAVSKRSRIRGVCQRCGVSVRISTQKDLLLGPHEFFSGEDAGHGEGEDELS